MWSTPRSRPPGSRTPSSDRPWPESWPLAAPGPVVVYARFFLHAITDAAQAEMISAIAAELRSDDLFAVEYRTTKDAGLAKETTAHYRRYIDPARLIVEVSSQDYSVEYAVEGFGFAQYHHDDAHVARVMMRRA
ncbi:MAG: hypothetical protein H7201_12920 [Candidatus Saccharibacteria bacterium]|nr:hypothetical protein [Microbacteriaceae bacterium]